MVEIGNLLKKRMYDPLIPVIIETKYDKFQNVREIIKDISPPLLSASEKSLLPGVISPSFFRFREMKLLKMISTILTPRLLDSVLQDNKYIKKVYLNRTMRVLSPIVVSPDGIFKDKRTNAIFTTVNHSSKMIGTDKANSMGYNGEGIIVSIPDTGGAPWHRMTPNLTFKTVQEGQYKDKNGHGAWCAATIGGHSWKDPRFNMSLKGIAPQVKMYGIKCLGYVIGSGATSDVLEAMEMAAKFKSDIVSMSLGGSYDPSDNPEEVGINKIVQAGGIPVVAAGNSGSGDGTIGTPGACRNALTVGAWDEIRGCIADFSSRNDTMVTNKPDVVAPGVNILSGSCGILDYLSDQKESRSAILSGTSMATPHVAGLLALAREYYAKEFNTQLTVDMVKKIMELYGNTKNTEVGWGIIYWDYFTRYADEYLKTNESPLPEVNEFQKPEFAEPEWEDGEKPEENEDIEEVEKTPLDIFGVRS